MTGRHAAPAGARPGDLLVRVGAVLFAVGLLAALVTVVPAVVRQQPAQGAAVAVAGTLLPLGFALALVGLLRGARTARRVAKRSSTRN